MMKRLILAALVLAAATPAAAQRRPTITLFTSPNFTGEQRSFSADVSNMADQGFNDRAQSARVVGRWRACEDARMRGRCVELSGNVPNLAALRLMNAISSVENLNPGGGFPGGGGGYPGGGYPGGGSGGPSLNGRTATFFPDPGGNWRNANDFCRAMGFSSAAYAENRGRLSDVLCRR